MEILTTVAVHWFEITVITILSGIGGVVFKIYIQYKANRAGTMALLEDRLQQAHTYFIQQEFLYVHQKKILFNLYYSYKNLDGNGIMDRMMKELDAMPVKTYIGKEHDEH